MRTLEEWQRALQTEPKDPLIWYVLADWLEEQGQSERAELVRLWRAEVKPMQPEGRNSERRWKLEKKGVTLPLPQEENSIGMRMVWIPPGTFMMGQTKKFDRFSHDHESPRHEVTITKGFYMGLYEVTQEEYERVMGVNPSVFKGPRRPVERVSWKEAMEFCKRLSELPEEKAKGHLYRLPTEAEWEYSCRGGVSNFSIYHFGNTIPKANANFGRNVGQTRDVGTYASNGFGLYDMHGNVWEWCIDGKREYRDRAQVDPRGPMEDGSNRVIRGGSWSYSADYCRAAYRNWCTPTSTGSNLGLRLAREC